LKTSLNDGFDVGRKFSKTTRKQDPDFGVLAGRIFGFFGFGLDWISFPFQPDPDHPNEIQCGHAKHVDME